jgi:hypothetical protein
MSSSWPNSLPLLQSTAQVCEHHMIAVALAFLIFVRRAAVSIDHLVFFA